MGDTCSPKNMAAILIAHGQRGGVDPFREAQRLKELNAKQKAHYELAIQDLMGINPTKKPNQRSVYDVLDQIGVKSKPKDVPDKIGNLADGELYDTPSNILPEAFYNSVDAKLEGFVKTTKGLTGKPLMQKYNKLVASPVNKLMRQLDKQIVSGRNTADLDRKLKGFGLKSGKVYEARDWLGWLSKGGHLQYDDSVVGFLAARSAKAMANFNLLWSGGNIVDNLRPISVYANRKGGWKAIGETILENVKSNPFKRRKDLEAENIYSYQGGEERIDFGNSDPFAWSLTMQKNFVHDLDIKMGGDGKKAIEDLVFDTKPWNVPRLYRSRNSGAIFSLVRYPINESRWLFKEHVKAVKAVKAGNFEEAMPLLTYLGLRAAIIGGGSNIPSFIFEALPDENENLPMASKKFWRDVDQFSILGGGNAALKAAGIDVEVDLKSYFQPFGGKLGVRYGIVSDTLVRTGKSSVKGGLKLAEGDLPAASLEFMVAASALNNILGLGQTASFVGRKAKLLNPGQSFEKLTQIGDKLNATILTKMLETTAKALDEEFTGGRFTRELAKDIAGSQRIRKPAEEKAGKKRKRGNRGKRGKKAAG